MHKQSRWHDNSWLAECAGFSPRTGDATVYPLSGWLCGALFLFFFCLVHLESSADVYNEAPAFYRIPQNSVSSINSSYELLSIDRWRKAFWSENSISCKTTLLLYCRLPTKLLKIIDCEFFIISKVKQKIRSFETELFSLTAVYLTQSESTGHASEISLKKHDKKL